MSLPRASLDPEPDKKLTKPKGKANEVDTKRELGKATAPNRFKPGNKGGPGNPMAKHASKYKLAWYVALGPKRFKRIIKRGAYLAERAQSLTEWRAFMSLAADRLMGKLPNTIIQAEGTPPADLDADPDAGVYD